MSYGREPHYIIDCACDGASEVPELQHPKEPHVCFTAGCLDAVSWSKLAQFVQRLHARGELTQVLDGTHPRLAAKVPPEIVPPTRS